MAPATKGTSNCGVSENFYLTFFLAAQASDAWFSERTRTAGARHKRTERARAPGESQSRTTHTALFLPFLLRLAEIIMTALARTEDLFGLGTDCLGLTIG